MLVIKYPKKRLYLCRVKIKDIMETMNLERLTVEELASIKGGHWVVVNGELQWVEGRIFHPASESEN